MGIRIRRWDYLNHSQAVALSKRAYSLHSPIRFRVTTGAQKITGKDHPSPRTHRPRRSTTKRSLSPDQNLDKGAFFPSWATTVRAMITSPAKIGSRARRYGRNPSPPTRFGRPDCLDSGESGHGVRIFYTPLHHGEKVRESQRPRQATHTSSGR